MPLTFHTPTRLLHELRLHKSADEIDVMRAAAGFTAEAHIAAMAMARAGRPRVRGRGRDVGVWRRRGSTGPGYTPIVAGGINATVLHYYANRDALVEGDLLLIDAAAEASYYTADVTRTFPVAGRFSGPQRDVYQFVLERRSLRREVQGGAGPTIVHDRRARVLAEAMVGSDSSRAIPRRRSRARPTSATTCTAPATGSGSTCTMRGSTTATATVGQSIWAW